MCNSFSSVLLEDYSTNVNKLNINKENGEKLPFQYVVFSGNIAGGVSAIVTQPIDTLRTNQMALSVGTKRVSVFKTAKHVIATENEPTSF